MPLKVHEGLPDPANYAVGAIYKFNGTDYAKSLAGGWGVAWTPKMLKLVHATYVKQGHGIRETKKMLSGGEGFPELPVQKMVEVNGWSRSHYTKTTNHQVLSSWVASNHVAVRRALLHGISFTDIAAWAGLRGLRKADLRAILGNDSLVGVSSGHLPRPSGGWLDQAQVETWNAALNTDLTSLSFKQYGWLVHSMSFLALRAYGDIEGRYNGDLDHKLSKFYGYYTKESYPSRFHHTPGYRERRREPVPLALMAHPINMRFVSLQENSSKWVKSIITVKRLRSEVARSDFQIQPINYSGLLHQVLTVFGMEKTHDY